MARRVGLTREQVIAAAADLADAHGLDQVSLAQLATRLGIRLPTLYHYFDGMSGLQRELAYWGVGQIIEHTRQAIIGKTADAAIIALAHSFRAYVLEHPGVYAATVRAPAADDAELEQLSQTFIDIVLAILEPYQLDQESSIHAVRGLRSIMHGFATLENAGGFGLPLDRDESFQRLVRSYLTGLRSQAVRHIPS